jgi:hypothetical protein
MKRIFAVIVASLVVLLCGDVYGKRLAPKEVPPVVHEGVKYTATLTGISQTEPQNGGFVQAWDVRTQKLLWQVKVYRIKYDPNLESDVQDVFITSMEIKNSKLIVVNERNEQFEIDLKTHAVRSVQEVLPWQHGVLVEENASPLVIGETFTIGSKILGETRRMNVYLPATYTESPNEKFPVLYMPDGGMAEDFLHVAGLVQVSVGNGTMRPFILVGIENTQRRR